jgi:phosphatidylethanolamine-binding protein (PEBP) family uncharacterized protein
LTLSLVDPTIRFMKLWSDSIAHGDRISARYALGRPSPKTHVELSDNVSPHLAWSEVPAGARSLALIIVDVDVPSRGDDVNQEGRVVPPELPRVDFYHLSLVDLPPDALPVAEGELARGVTARGKPPSAAPRGTRVGLNDYTGWFKGDPAMEGEYFGYDGPCPPWNDSLVHHYHFRLFALDVPRCPVDGVFDGRAVSRAVKDHVLAAASFVGSYAIFDKAIEKR